MAKQTRKEHQLRMDGMAYAYRIAKEYGLETLEKEIKFRNANFVPLECNIEAVRDINSVLAQRMLATIMSTIYFVLYEKLKFREEEIKTFQKEFFHYCDLVDNFDPYGEHFVTIADLAEEMNERYPFLALDVDIIRTVESENDGRRKDNQD